MSTAPTSSPDDVSEVSTKDTDQMTVAELTAHVLGGAGERVQAAVARLTRMGVIDARGTVLSSDLPADMRPDSQTTVVTG